jgi:hypothetical protein
MNDELFKRMGKGHGAFGAERHNQKDMQKMERMMRRHDRDEDFEMYGKIDKLNLDDKTIYIDTKNSEGFKFQDDLDSEAES